MAAQLALAETKNNLPDTVQLQSPFGKKDKEAFAHPAKNHYPETWFHFINGNIDRKGVTKDLEAIAGAGITGVSLFHGKMGDSRIDWPGTAEHIECLSPQWESLLTYTASEAKRLGLRFSLQTCPGWAMSGGPWIKPEQSMRHLTHTRTDIEGGKLIEVQLPTATDEDYRDYRDLCTLAFPTPSGDTDRPLAVKQVKADKDEAQWLDCLNARGRGSFQLQPGKHVVEFELAEAETLRTLEFNPIDNFNHEFGVDPGIHVRLVALMTDGSEQEMLDADFPMANWQDSDYPMSFALNEARSLRYRLEMTTQHRANVSRVRLYSGARKNNWEAEAGFTCRAVVRENERPLQSSSAFVKQEGIVDLTDRMNADGKLCWQAPQGKWTILRIGHINTGRQNGPAPDEATGWEVNKFDRSMVDYQFKSYVGRLAEGALDGLLDNMLMDSWECSSQTWTEGMEKIFIQTHGYELLRWMPALFGYVLEDHETSAGFLCDWRSVLNRLFVDNFYGRMAENARSKSMTVQYETAAGDIFPGDPMEFYKWADVPMTEFWQPFHHFLANHNYKPIRATASAARMYGKPRVEAESFTSFDLTWDEHLSMLREVANQNTIEGVSHITFHTYTHNPDADRYFPGTTFGAAIGTPFLRKQTWWPFMPLFTRYLARLSYMLERGKPVSDVLWYIGDEVEQKPDQFTAFPEGYRYDYCNQDALLNRLDVRDGRWVTPDGISYSVMWIPERVERMTPKTLNRLAELVRKGGILIAQEPAYPATHTISVEDFREAAHSLWKGDQGKGRIVSGKTIDEALRLLALPQDVKPTEALWLHRKAEGADWYMICAPKEKSFQGDIAFHSQGNAELWDPIHGTTTPIAATVRDGYSTIHVTLERGECFFVVFDHKSKPQKVRQWQEAEQPLNLQWTLTFPEGWGIDRTYSLSELKPWKDLDASAEGKAFSGTATYATTIDMPKVDKRQRYELQLGRVEEIAVIRLNGEVVDSLWAAPYFADLTPYLRKGQNRLEVDVTSTWRNRLIYDAGLPEDKRRTWTIAAPGANSPLCDYGLLGPVKLKVKSPL